MCGCKQQTVVRPKVTPKTINNSSNKTSVTVTTFKSKS
jgi:hypothetical protein